MILISQHSRLLGVQFPQEAVFRVNAAWIKTRTELFDLIEQINGKVFLDYPKNRTKPPLPTLLLEDMFEAMERFRKIEFFAVSNVVGVHSVEEIRTILPNRTILVPKIESKEGINSLEVIMDSLNVGDCYLMLDKEDLYTDLDKDDQLFEKYIDIVRGKCKKGGYKLLELMGVIFSDECTKQTVMSQKERTIESIQYNKPEIESNDDVKAVLHRL